ncbi:MAG: 16S rRNA (guanine(527)-N(7))-methyltransferase RsmG [Oscillospiraceae bacterium]|jgi:16S rRNA (guanine527-N7)-methyltransferase|nr:16S rRNA (guanine(527)-N(7))-methyltransferase RsmG [Oscillospiraceae bacterium]
MDEADTINEEPRAIGNRPYTLSPKFKSLYELLIEKNKVMNLTAITEEREVEALHFRDSLAVLEWIPEGAFSVVDVGTGAGFPGLPIAIARPELRVTLLDATEKKVEFLKDVAAQLDLANVTCVCARAEDYAKTARASFDFAVARALAKLNALCELCMPLVKPGGAFIALKSAQTDEEIADAARAIHTLGGELEAVTDYTLPGTDIPRRAVVIRQKTAAPEQYPRGFAKIKKQPL